MAVVKELFIQFFQTFRQSWENLLFFSVFIGVLIDTVIIYKGISLYSYIAPTPYGAHLAFFVVLVYSIIIIANIIFSTLPVFFLLVYPDQGKLSITEIYDKILPYIKPTLCLSIFYIINFFFHTKIFLSFTHISNELLFLIFLYLFIYLCTIILDGTIFFMIRDQSKLQTAFKDTIKTLARHFFPVCLLIFPGYLLHSHASSYAFASFSYTSLELFVIRSSIAHLEFLLYSFLVYFTFNRYHIQKSEI